MLPIHRNLVTIKLRCFYNNLVCNEFSSWSVCTYPYMKYPFSISTRCFLGRLANALLTYEQQRYHLIIGLVIVLIADAYNKVR
jgi:hypothetical protein